MTKPRTPVHLRVLQKIHVEGDCWIWTGKLNAQGYGYIWAGGHRENHKELRVHRAVYEALVGPIPDDMTIDHLCHSKACVNPAHLEVVTRGENARRAWRDGLCGASGGRGGSRTKETHCQRGHELVGDNLYVDPTGKRRCRVCRRGTEREGYIRAKRADA